MIAGILSGIGKAALSLLSTVITEVLFKKVLARLAVNIINWLVDSTKTDWDDEFAQPFIEKLKEQY